ncbi:hypothetical protein J5N97_019722 [Dioscorea zingiberensis]|uniref:rRNA N-glycosylase n=1 Tax=Dioscorea zingiberensis TaxID=325984 RepID=A0A9D5HD51_9LILI|nr:hypothetical protein J5N97_019722 [Dioscorea zingiberensis]
MVNMYVVAYQAGDESFFLREAPDGAHEQLFTSTTQYTLPFNGSYIDLQRHAEENRDQIRLGTTELIQAITGLRYPGGSNRVRASSLIVIIKMISEAARFNPILWRVRQHIDSGESFLPDTYMLNLETSWGSQSREVQQSIEGVFNSPIRLQIAHGDHFITLSNVRDVIASLALMLFKCRAPPSSTTSSDHEQYPNSLLLIRPVVPEENYYVVILTLMMMMLPAVRFRSPRCVSWVETACASILGMGSSTMEIRYSCGRVSPTTMQTNCGPSKVTEQFDLTAGA